LILALWPILVPGTKITNPSILAIPSPRLLVSEIVTLYSLPTSTGFLREPKPPPPPRLPNPPPRVPKLILFTYPTVISSSETSAGTGLYKVDMCAIERAERRSRSAEGRPNRPVDPGSSRGGAADQAYGWSSIFHRTTIASMLPSTTDYKRGVLVSAEGQD
jgi:hypothetical protein